MPVEECENCGQGIGEMEIAHVWNNRVVCALCYGRLSRSKPEQPWWRGKLPILILAAITLSLAAAWYWQMSQFRDRSRPAPVDEFPYATAVEELHGRVLKVQADFQFELRDVNIGTTTNDVAVAEVALEQLRQHLPPETQELSDIRRRVSILERALSEFRAAISDFSKSAEFEAKSIEQRGKDDALFRSYLAESLRCFVTYDEHRQHGSDQLRLYPQSPAELR